MPAANGPGSGVPAGDVSGIRQGGGDGPCDRGPGAVRLDHLVHHPYLNGTFDPAGRYTLELPYRDDRELLLEILKHGAGVEVLAPEELRTKVREAHLDAARINRSQE